MKISFTLWYQRLDGYQYMSYSHKFLTEQMHLHHLLLQSTCRLSLYNFQYCKQWHKCAWIRLLKELHIYAQINKSKRNAQKLNKLTQAPGLIHKYRITHINYTYKTQLPSIARIMSRKNSKTHKYVRTVKNTVTQTPGHNFLNPIPPTM